MTDDRNNQAPVLMYKADFAENFGFTRQAVTNALSRGKLIQTHDKRIDVTDPVNLKWINRPKRPPRKDRGVKKTAPKKKAARKKVEKRETVKTVRIEKQAVAPLEVPRGADPLLYMDDEELERHKKIEGIREKQQKNKTSRLELIDRHLVKVVMGAIHTVDTQELLTLAPKLAPQICGLCGSDEPGLIHEAEQMIDAEIYKVLDHIHQIISDFLGSVGESLEEK